HFVRIINGHFYRMSSNPRVFLAIDNCFASKRWTEPKEWMSIIKDLGIHYVEASADNESDPLYSTGEYLRKWVDEIHNLSVETGVNVCNLYSGHGTYATLGLAHTDESVRDHIQNDWLKKMVDNAALLNAGLGFYCHAFDNKTLQENDLYVNAYKDLIERLAVISSYANQANLTSIGIEQMYTPHQIPWTVKGASDMMKSIYKISNHPFYITIDVGHQSGQRRFLRPGIEMFRLSLEKPEEIPEFWVGSDKAYRLFEEAKNATEDRRDEILDEIQNDIDSNPHLYASYDDGDPCYWIEKLGCFSPIIHLQQTDGTHSSHLPFIDEHNEKGIITGEEVLEKLYSAYQQKPEAGMPPKCREIFLTIEVFSSTTDIPFDILKNLEKSVEYWRKFVPEDGIKLSKLIEKL
ncbi:TIM barrel protein, partial [Bacteroidota bacterium]